MTVKRKKKNFPGGRMMTVAFSLCLLAVVTMIGMYTVGKSDQKQQELEAEIAKAEKTRALEEEKRKEQEKKEQEEKKQETASHAARNDSVFTDETAKKEPEKEGEQPVIDGAELESDFAGGATEVAEGVAIEEELQEASTANAVAEQPLSFSPETDRLMWPVAGNIILDFSMDKSVYFSTLNQYKYNPAVIIQGNVNENVMCGAAGKISSITVTEETGTTVAVDIGDGYQLIYGQLKELPVEEGDAIKAGETVGYVSEPTKYYSKEGCNVYFEVQKDGTSIDPMSLLQ